MSRIVHLDAQRCQGGGEAEVLCQLGTAVSQGAGGGGGQRGEHDRGQLTIEEEEIVF